MIWRQLLGLALVFTVPGSVASQTGPRNVEWVAYERSAQVREVERRALDAVLNELKPQRPGIVDAYVIVAALHSDAVFGREARETGRVLSRRFNAEGRTIVLAAGQGGPGTPPASPESLTAVLARIGQLADPREDVLVFYTTTHGAPQYGLQYNDPQRGFGWISPERLASMLDGSAMPNRLLLLSACYSGTFLPRLESVRSLVITAAASDRASFGCSPGNDWTFFGDALINRALRKPQPLPAAFAEARRLVGEWETRANLPNSNPQIGVGGGTGQWLASLEKQKPAKATIPVGRSPAAGNPP